MLRTIYDSVAEPGKRSSEVAISMCKCAFQAAITEPHIVRVTVDFKFPLNKKMCSEIIWVWYCTSLQ